MTIRIPTSPRRGFTLIELLVVIAIIVLLAGLMFPALKSLTKSNTQAQAVNVVRAYLNTARSVAISQHRVAGVVFFEQSTAQANPNQDKPQYAGTLNPQQTAMQLIVADFDQTGVGAGQLRFRYYSQDRQYLPVNVQVAALNDVTAAGTSNVQTAENVDTTRLTRAILFDENGQLTLRSGLTTPAIPAVFNATPSSTNPPGSYPQAYGDWAFMGTKLNRNGTAIDVTGASSSPGFFIFNKNEYDSMMFPTGAPGDQARATWIKAHADVVIVNAYTGNVLR